MPINPKQKQQLKATAHSLKPIVLLGQHGLTEAVHREIDQALLDHELIKVRIPSVDRDERRQIITTICQIHRAESVQAIGHVVVLYRKNIH